jgi:hypothetical protein
MDLDQILSSPGDAAFLPRGRRSRHAGSGQRCAESARSVVALVGSRAATSPCSEVARRLGRPRAPRVTVVSGMARGVAGGAGRWTPTAHHRRVRVRRRYHPPNPRARRAHRDGALSASSARHTRCPPLSAAQSHHQRVVARRRIVEAAEGSSLSPPTRARPGREVLAVPGNILGGRHGAHAPRDGGMWSLRTIFLRRYSSGFGIPDLGCGTKMNPAREKPRLRIQSSST